MNLTKKTRYAVRIMIDIAQQEGQRMPLGATARRQEISAKYCEQIIAELRIAGLVKSIRGSRGGYVLARPGLDITFGDIVRAVNDPYGPSEDSRDEAIENAFEKVQTAMWGVLDAMTLAEIAEG
jgi:Rrf2 family protein